MVNVGMDALKLQFAHNCVLATAEVDGEQHPLIIPREQYLAQTGMDSATFAEKSRQNDTQIFNWPAPEKENCYE
jgi:hypothetical protein